MQILAYRVLAENKHSFILSKQPIIDYFYPIETRWKFVFINTLYRWMSAILGKLQNKKIHWLELQLSQKIPLTKIF